LDDDVKLVISGHDVAARNTNPICESDASHVFKISCFSLLFTFVVYVVEWFCFVIYLKTHDPLESYVTNTVATRITHRLELSLLPVTSVAIAQ
jgi:hypothetical protein